MRVVCFLILSVWFTAAAGGSAAALSVTPTLSGVMTLSHNAGARSSTSLAVVSLASAWSLTMRDSSGSSPGFLKPCALLPGLLSGVLSSGGQPLSQGLRFSTSSSAQTDASLYLTLGSGTQPVGTGSFSQTKTVYWFQPSLTNSDSVAGGAGYCTKVTFTLTETA